MRVACEQGREVQRGLTRERGDPLGRGVQVGDIQRALRGGIEQPLGAAQRIGLVGGTHSEVRGTDHFKTIP